MLPFDGGPDEIAANRPAQLNRVVGLQLAGEERRHLAVIQALDREFQLGGLGRRGNRVAPFRAIAVLGRQAHVGVLARKVAGPVVDREPDGLHPMRLFADGDDRRGLPGGWSGSSNHRRTAVPATGRHSCGTR